MSIRRTGFIDKTFVKCVKTFTSQDSQFNEGEVVELVLDMGTSLVVKKPDGLETVVSKDYFDVENS